MFQTLSKLQSVFISIANYEKPKDSTVGISALENPWKIFITCIFHKNDADTFLEEAKTSTVLLRGKRKV